MKIIEKIFEECMIIEPTLREDNRGVMEVFYCEREINHLIRDFKIAEQRIYKMPKCHTFFGIHYQKAGKPQGKLISVIQGKGIDYIVDLRPDSSTYKKYVSIELQADTRRLVYIAPGFGHGFLSMENNTIQLFAIDTLFDDEQSGVISYNDPEIGLTLPVDDITMSDYDLNA